MAIQKITIAQFLTLSKTHTVLDVRSPGEYVHAHIPGAVNLPLFSDEQRKVVGTAYKQQGKQPAIKIGLDYFGEKMKGMVETVEELQAAKTVESGMSAASSTALAANTVLVHCWRGGMRSAGVAWLLDLYGFNVYTLTGGYKAFRRWAGSQFEMQWPFNTIGGYTGSGKTRLLYELNKRNEAVIDLEGLARHKGSAFGGLGEGDQPSQEMFENLLAKELYNIREEKVDADRYTIGQDIMPGEMEEKERVIYIEDESQRIGRIVIPGGLWTQLRSSSLHFFVVPFEERLNYLTEAYGSYNISELVDGVLRIQKKLGGLDAKNAIAYLREGKIKEGFGILLRYYDKYYDKGFQARSQASPVNKITCATVDISYMINALTNEKTIAE